MTAFDDSFIITQPDGLMWDGSHIGNIDEKVIMEISGKRGELKHFIFKWDTMTTVITYHVTDSALPAIIDELAPFFAIKKVGTHQARYRKKDIILYNTTNQYQSLNNCRKIIMKEELCLAIQDIIVFRLFMGITSCMDRHIALIEEEPVSICNKRTKREIRHVQFSYSVWNNWFVDTIDDSKKRMKIFTPESFIRLRTNMELIFKRLDPKLIFVITEIVNNINKFI